MKRTRRSPAQPADITTAPPAPRARTARWVTLLAIATALTFSAGLRAPFYFDDLPSIQQNASIRQLTPVAGLFSPPGNTSVSGRPVVNVTLALNYAVNDLFGVDQRPDPAGLDKTVSYHVVNLLFHLGCGLLLFGILRRTLRKAGFPEDGIGPDEIAAWSALLWLLHPIQTEAVYYVIARTELVVSFFYLATLYAAIRAWDAATAGARRNWAVLAAIVCALGMGSKEVMVTAPFVVLLYDRAFRAASWRALWNDRARRRLYAALVATEGIVAAFVVANGRDRSVGFGLGISWFEYLLTQAWAVAHYLRLIAWPSGLNFDYGEIAVHDSRWIPGALVLTAIAAATLVAWRRDRTRRAAFLGVWFFVLLAPSSSVVPIRTEVAAERRVYLAGAAVVVAVILALVSLQRARGWRPRFTRIGVGVAAVACAALSFDRGGTFLDPLALYGSVILASPNNPRGYIGAALASVQAGPGHLDSARTLLHEAMRVDTLNFVAPDLLGVTELSRGDTKAAEVAFDRALTLRPDDPQAERGLARVFVNLRQPDSAARFVSVQTEEDNDLLWDLGWLFVEQGRGAVALPYLERASREPHALGLALLSVAYAQAGAVDRAEAMAERAIRSAGDTANVFTLAGRAMLIVKDLKAARADLERAMALDPRSEETKRLLGLLPR